MGGLEERGAQGQGTQMGGNLGELLLSQAGEVWMERRREAQLKWRQPLFPQLTRPPARQPDCFSVPLSSQLSLPRSLPSMGSSGFFPANPEYRPAH